MTNNTIKNEVKLMTIALKDKIVIRRIKEPERFERINFLMNSRLKSSDLIMFELCRALRHLGTEI